MKPRHLDNAQRSYDTLTDPKYELLDEEEVKERFVCKKGETVVHRGKKMLVIEVFSGGVNPRDNGRGCMCAGEKSWLIACRIMSNGQALTRSAKNIGDDWI